jgi:hypothetical protein
MKRILTIAALSLAALSMNAQDKNFKPVSGSMTVEFGLTGGLLSTNFISNGSTTSALGLASSFGLFRIRYHQSDKLAFRLGFGSRITNDETSVTAPAPFNPYPQLSGYTRSDKQSVFEVNLGVEKHLLGTNRLATYIGADLVYSAQNASYERLMPNGDYSKFSNTSAVTQVQYGFSYNQSTMQNVYTSNYNEVATAPRSGTNIGIRIITGANYYFTRKLYLGTEIGLGFFSGTTKEVRQKTSTGGVVSDVQLFKSGKTFRNTMGVVTGLSLGYQF